MIPPGTFHSPGLPKEWNVIIDRYAEGAKQRAREERGKRKGGKRRDAART